MNRLSVLIGTFNSHKLKELSDIMSDVPVDLIGLGDLEESVDEVEEVGTTFAENAMLKARFYAEASGMITLADDSGLEIDALDGRPGLYSSRYAPTNDERIQRVLREMVDVQDGRRAARFVCAMALEIPGQESIVQTGTVEGEIARKPSGKGGFGYDPIFFSREHNCTMAELPPSVKNKISHRARAAEEIKPYLIQLASQFDAS